MCREFVLAAVSNSREVIMDKQSVIGKLSGRAPEIRLRFSVKALSVFGSVARGEAAEGSDVDVLVAFEQKATFDLFMDLKFYLEDLLGKGVDLVTDNALRPEVRHAIERDSVAESRKLTLDFQPDTSYDKL